MKCDVAAALPFLSLLPSALAHAIPSPDHVTSTRGPSTVARQSLNDILAIISEYFPVNEAITDIGNLIADGDQVLADALGWSTSQSDLSDGQCGDVIVVFARGTDEPGNVGALVGPPFFDALQTALGGASLVLQGVNNYSASVTGFLEGGDPSGSQEMATQVQQAISQCPDAHVVMSGYSQGGQIVHNAAKLLPASTTAAVGSVVIFGDPDDGQAVTGADSSRVLVVCHSDDNICAGGDLILLPHLTYFEDAATAASFVATNAGL